MKFLSKSLGLLLALTLFAPTLATSEKCHEEEVVKYIQGGARPGGNGSKKHPFASLADAESATWDVLIVLSSPFDLDGGITLKPGQKLIGDEDPTGIVSTTQPTITNTGTTHGGNGVVVTGDATIKNIFFNFTSSGGINTNQAKNLMVQNVRITGFNQNPSLGSSTGIGGLEQNSGETRLENVIISNPSGKGLAGISEKLVANGIHRKLSLCDCEFSQLPVGIDIQLVNPDTSSSVVIENSYFHDFAANGEGIQSFLFSNNSRQTMLVKGSTFYNVGRGGGNAIALLPHQNSQLELKVDSCSFQEILVPNTADGVLVDSFNNSTATICIANSTFTNIGFAIMPTSENSSSIKTTVEKSIGNNVGSFFIPQVLGGQQMNKLCGNTVTGNIFYDTSTGGPTVEQSFIEGNVFNGSTGFLIQSPFAGAAWKLLEISAKDNCFNGGNAPGSIGFKVQSGNSGAIVIKAHENTFAGFKSDITDGGSSANYLVSKNFWGTPTVACTSTSMCGKYQVCENSFCFGPTVTTVGTGFIDASNPLLSSITCPTNCFDSKLGTSTPSQTSKFSAEEMLEMIEKKGAKIKARYQQTNVPHVS